MNTATTTNQAPQTINGGLLEALAPIGLMLIFFYFLIMRPQQKREAKRRELIKSIKKGDKIVTSGGIIGSVHKIISDEEISLEISEGVRMHILRNMIAQVLDKKSSLGQMDEVEQPKKKTKKNLGVANEKLVSINK